MAALYHEFKGSDLAILKISIKEREKVVLTYQEQFKIAFPILLDEKAKVANAFGVWSHPTTLFINRNGQVVGRVIGERDWMSESMKTLIKYLLESEK